MKALKVILLMTMSISILTGCKETKTTPKHIGEWKRSDKDEEVSLILNEDNKAVFVMGNQVMGGPDFSMEGFSCDVKYEINYDVSPISFDIIISTLDSFEGQPINPDVKLPGIMRFLTDDKVEYRINMKPNSNRPESFDQKEDETIVLNRVTKE